MSCLLLDTWNEGRREIMPNGFSMIKTVGNRELDDLPNCPTCRRQVWPRVITHADKIEFTGKRIGDISYGFSATFVVGDRFVEVWKKSCFTGIFFSDCPLHCTFRKRAVFATPSKDFYFAYPEAKFSALAPEAGAVLATPPRCTTCNSSEVLALDRPVFEASALEGIDCCLPSCLPGWTIFSERAFEVISSEKLLNFQFMEGFRHGEDKNLTRLGCYTQDVDGVFSRYDSWVLS